MNLSRCIYRLSSKGSSISDLNFKFIERKNICVIKALDFNCQKGYCKSISSVIEASALSTKRLNKKKKALTKKEGIRIMAFSTAKEYKLESLSVQLPGISEFAISSFGNDFGSAVDVVHATKQFDFSKKKTQTQDLFFFRDGCVVMWNLSDPECKNILDFLKNFEKNSFDEELIQSESEVMSFSVSEDVPQGKILRDTVLLSAKNDVLMEKYTVSNAMALSVILGTYEANLEKYIETMEPVTEDLQTGKKIKMTRNEVLQKMGQLFAFRHNINLNSDLLDTPDFYWDREELENLYQSTFNYFCISKRTKVINEKINHCIELVELLSSHLNDKHHVRLEWMIIVLIMVEVAFEIVHYVDKYLEADKK